MKKIIILLFSMLLFFRITIANAQSGTTVQKGDLIIDLETGEIIKEGGVRNDGGGIRSETSNTSNPVPIATPTSTPDELLNAIHRMYNNGLTKFNTKIEYMSESFLTREQMAKMVAQAYKVLGYPNKNIGTGCGFSDLAEADPTLKPFIQESCKLGLLNGRDGAFHNQGQLTKAQTLTILIRIFEGKKSDENIIPRRKNYVNKAQSIGLTNDKEYSNYDKSITRGQVAMLFYRFKSISENSILRQSVLSQMQDASSEKVDKINTKTLDDGLSLLTQGIAVGDDPELREAIFRMYQQGLTKYKDAEDFRAFDQIERQEATKFIGQFHQKFIKTGNLSSEISSDCYFKDLQDAEDFLQPYILYACQEGIFAGKDGRFHPTHSLLKSEFVASLIRMLGKKQQATGDVIRWKPYFDIGLKLGLINYVDRITFDKPITRYEVALILYRFRIKYKLLSNLNSNNLENQIISMIENSTKEIDGHRQAKVYITTTKLHDQNFSIGYIELFGKRYKVVKKNIEKYFHNNFVWYGEVYDMITDKPTGTLSMIISNNTILEGNIRPELSGKNYYQILKPEETNSYYIIREKEVEEEGK